MRLLRSRSVGTARSTGYAHGADGRRCRGEELHSVEVQVAHEDRLAYAQRSYVDNQFVGQLVELCAHGQLAGRENERIGVLHAFRFTCQTYVDRNGDRFARLYALIVHVENLLADGVELHVAEYGFFGFAVDLQIYDVGVGRVDLGFQLHIIHRERNHFAAAVENGRNLTFAAYRLCCFLAVVFTLDGLYLDCFHCNLFFVCVTLGATQSASRRADPLNACGAKDKHLFPENKKRHLALRGFRILRASPSVAAENGGPLPESGSLWLQDEAARDQHPVQDVLFGSVFRVIGRVCVEVIREGVQQRREPVPQGPVRCGELLLSGRLAGGGFGDGRAARSAVQIERGLHGDAHGAGGSRRCELFAQGRVLSFGEFLPECRAGHGEEIAGFRRRDIDGADRFGRQVAAVGESEGDDLARGYEGGHGQSMLRRLYLVISAWKCCWRSSSGS